MRLCNGRTSVVAAALVAGAPAVTMAGEDAVRDRLAEGSCAPHAFAWRAAAGGAFLGVQLDDLTADERDQLGGARSGVEVTAVVEDSPAARGGLHEGDVIVEFDGLRVRSAAQLVRLVRETVPGTEVELGVERDGTYQELVVELGERTSPLDALGRLQVDPDFELDFDMPEGLDELQEKLQRLPERLARPRPEGAPHVGPAPTPHGWHLFRAPGPASGARLGVEVQSLNDQLREYFDVSSGVLVTRVEPGSAAERAGVRAGDVIVAAGGTPIATLADLRRIVAERDEDYVLRVVRRGDELALTVDVPEREPAEGNGPHVDRL